MLNYKNFFTLSKSLFSNISKKILVFFLIFVSCTNINLNQNFKDWMQDNGKIKILSTTVMIHDLVQCIGGDKVDAIALIKGDLDPHSYELVKGDLEKIQYSHIVFYNGLGLEHGASLFHSIKNHRNHLAVGDMVFQKNPQKILFHDTAIDPHIWTDVSLWMEVIDPIVEKLSQLRPQFSQEFLKRAKLLKKQMIKLHKEIFHLIQKIPGTKRYLVTSHDAFNYFTKAYLAEPGEDNWKIRFQAPEGLAPDGQLCSNDIQKILDHLKTYQIHVIFSESNVNKDSIYKIVSSGKKNGLDVKIANEVLFGDAILDDPLSKDCYLQTMKHNAEVIFRFLNRP